MFYYSSDLHRSDVAFASREFFLLDSKNVALLKSGASLFGLKPQKKGRQDICVFDIIFFLYGKIFFVTLKCLFKRLPFGSAIKIVATSLL